MTEIRKTPHLKNCTEMKSMTAVSERVSVRARADTLDTECVLEASVVAVWGSVVHGQVHDVHVVVMGVDRRVDRRVVVVMVVVVVVVIVQGGQVL